MNRIQLWPPNAYDDETDSGRRLKTRGNARKRFVIQFCFPYSPEYLFFQSMAGWHTFSRYATEVARDQALAALVSKEQRRPRRRIRRGYRKLDE